MAFCSKCGNNFGDDKVTNFSCGHYICSDCFVKHEIITHDCYNCRSRTFSTYFFYYDRLFIRWLSQKKIFHPFKFLIVISLLILTIYLMVKTSKNKGKIVDCTDFVCEIQKKIPICEISLVENNEYKRSLRNEFCSIPSMNDKKQKSFDVLCDFNQNEKKIIYPCMKKTKDGYIVLCFMMLFSIVYLFTGIYYLIDFRIRMNQH